MKILWIVNTIFPYPAKKIGIEKTVFGGWLNGLAENIVKDNQIELAIATACRNVNKLEKYNDGKITYYILPNNNNMKYSYQLEEYWKLVNKDFNPDLVHIHGTEYVHGLSFINVCPNKKVITSIQGLLFRYGDVYCGNIGYENIKRNITFRDFIKHDNIFQAQQKFIKRSKYEKEIIEKSDAIIGRTTWDYANVKAINTNVKYYIGNETLRSTFYDKTWDINNVEKYTLFTSQANYPIKGFHYLLETINILKQKYPQVKLYVGGNNILDNSSIKSNLKRNGYAKYINKLIKEYDLKENIIFTGLLNAQEMVERLLKTHVFVLPSVIENSSNSLGEAMLLGMPCVASNTGGTMDILEHKKEGYLYPYTEPAMCAKYISDFFKDDDLCIKSGQEAQKTAKVRHDQGKNVRDILKIYNDIINDK